MLAAQALTLAAGTTAGLASGASASGATASGATAGGPALLQGLSLIPCCRGSPSGPRARLTPPVQGCTAFRLRRLKPFPLTAIRPLLPSTGPSLLPLLVLNFLIEMIRFKSNTSLL